MAPQLTIAMAGLAKMLTKALSSSIFFRNTKALPPRAGFPKMATKALPLRGYFRNMRALPSKAGICKMPTKALPLRILLENTQCFLKVFPFGGSCCFIFACCAKALF